MGSLLPPEAALPKILPNAFSTALLLSSRNYTFSPAPHVDMNDIRKATDAGECPLMDPYIRQVAHQNRFASPGRVD